MKQLNCYCDHCSNNTCATTGYCFGEVKRDDNDIIKETFNCFHQISDVVRNIACEDTTHKKIRCCSTDFCNNETNFRSSLLEASQQLKPQNFSVYMPTYSDIPPQIRIAAVAIFGLLLVLSIALFQNCFATKRRRRRGSVAILDQRNQNGNVITGNDAGNHDHDHSENSSNLVTSDGAIYDTNSMASREPLIQQYQNQNNQRQTAQVIYQSNALSHPHPNKSPWMLDESYIKAQSSFQMSTGSGDVQDKPEASSGSGSGQPYLTQRSIAHDIELVEVVGRGYFGVVWRGEYKGEPVAVKIFSALAEPSWEREAEIYQTTLLRHKNILGFIAIDKRDDVSMTGYWLVTDYYPMGSLFDFLRKNSLTISDGVRMAFSIASGLAHLHVEIFGTRGKPAIAHRDLKSKNILVKNDGTCCIADLGMAVRFNSSENVVDVPSNSRVGTRRYLAPELLENKFNLMDFEAVKATDIYALGLVLWEILRRTCYSQPGENSVLVGTSMPQYINQQYSPQQLPPMQRATPAQIISVRPVDVPSSLDVNESSTLVTTDAITPVQNQSYSTPIKQEPRAQERFLQSGNPPNPQETYPLKIADRTQQTAAPQVNDSLEASNDDLNSNLAFVCDPYMAPYQEYVSWDPSTEEMREVVCVRKIRPPTSERWDKFASMREYATLMRECWYEKPQARLSALRIRKTLGDIARHHFNLNMKYD